MSNLPFNPTLYLLFNLHCLLGGMAAVVAARKGYSLGRWLIWGLFGGTGALIVSVVMQRQAKQ
jgi:hypothetical protein